MMIIKTVLWESDVLIPVMNSWNESTNLKFNDVISVAVYASSSPAAW